MGQHAGAMVQSLLARGADHPTGRDATVYAAAYGLFIAAAVAAAFGDPVQEKLTRP